MEKSKFESLTKLGSILVGEGYEINFINILLIFYVLKRNSIDFNIIDLESSTNVNKVDKYISYLNEILADNLDRIEGNTDVRLVELVKDSLHRSNINNYFGNSLEHAILNASKLNLDEISYFINNYKREEIFKLSKNDVYTPKGIIELAIKLLDNGQKSLWGDCCCGNGNFLVTAAKKYPKDKFIGNDINFDNSFITRIRLYFSGVDNVVTNQDILLIPTKEKVDKAFMQAPYAIRVMGNAEIYNKLNKYIADSAQILSSDWYFIDRMLQTLKDNGRAVAIIPEGALMNFKDTNTRKQLIESNLIEGVISLPSNIFPYTAIKTSLLIFDMNKTSNDVKILDATEMYDKNKRINEIHFNEIYNAYMNLENAISKDKIEDKNYILTVNHYLYIDDITLKSEDSLENYVETIFRGAQNIISKPYDLLTDEEYGYKTLSVGDIEFGSFNKTSLKKIEPNENLLRYQLKDGDIVLSGKGTKIKSGVATIKEGEIIIATGSVLVIRCNKKLINPYYLQAFIDSVNGQKLLMSIQSGSTIISINVSSLMKMRIPAIDKKKQDIIAEKYILKRDQLIATKIRLDRLESEMVSIFDNELDG